MQVNEINQQTEIKDKAPKIQKNKNRYDSFHITNKLLKNYEEMRINGKRYYNNKRKIFKSNIIIIIYMIIINLIQINNSDNEYFVPNTTIQIKGPGTKKILSDYFFKNNNNFPNKIFINGNENTTMNYSYYLNQTNNTVQLLWNNSNIDSCNNMFYYCPDITEIDFSNFDTSKVINMAGTCCSSLTSLNLSNFDTSKVQHMYDMFYDCSLLTSLDLSNFNTANVEDMGLMFSGCSLLTSLNLSNFNTSKVQYMYNMFYDCSLLTSLDISNFNMQMLKTWLVCFMIVHH